MKHKHKRSGAILCALLMSAVTLQGCKADLPIPEDTVFTNGYLSYFPSMYCYTYTSYNDHLLKLLDFSSMESRNLCSKPNCPHTDQNCIIRRLETCVPLITDHYAYYFSDEPMEFYEKDDGKTDISIGSTLCCWDMSNDNVTPLMRVDGSSVSAYYGWQMHEGSIYYVANHLSRTYDENGNLLYCDSSGGEMNLCRVGLADQESVGLCKLYDIEALREYYPMAPHSAEAYMKGIFDHKLYFNIGFAADDETAPDGWDYRFYVTYYDLETGTYHGTPEDYANIDFAEISYCSADYLVIRRDRQITVTKQDSGASFTLTDDCFTRWNRLAVFDDMVFCGGKIFDLYTNEMYEPDVLKPDASKTEDYVIHAKEVIAAYENSYIVCDEAKNFEKIPASDLIPK